MSERRINLFAGGEDGILCQVFLFQLRPFVFVWFDDRVRHSQGTRTQCKSSRT